MTNKASRRAATGFERFESGSARRRRLLREEQLIVQVAEMLVELLERESVTRAELGRRLGKSKGFISQILAGDKNLTLRTVSDVCDALGFRAQLEASRDFVAQNSLLETVQTLSLNTGRVRVPDLPEAEPTPSGETQVAA